MRRYLLAFRCDCGVWFNENKRGLKTTRCRHCGRHVREADMPLALVAATYAQKKIHSDLADVPSVQLDRAVGHPAYGEFVRLKRHAVDRNALDRLVSRFSRSLRLTATKVDLDISKVRILVSRWSFRPDSYVAFAWRTVGRPH